MDALRRVRLPRHAGNAMSKLRRTHSRYDWSLGDRRSKCSTGRAHLYRFRAALNDTSDQTRLELERLQQKLEARQSTMHFAHSGIAFLAAVILAGVAAKLFWDALRPPLLGITAAVLSAALVLYGAYRYVTGSRFLKEELRNYEMLRALRRSLNIDDPSALLPQ